MTIIPLPEKNNLHSRRLPCLWLCLTLAKKHRIQRLCMCTYPICGMWAYLRSKTFKTKTCLIPLARIHPSGHLNLWSSVQVLPSYLVLLCAPPPDEWAPALFAHHSCILVSAVAHYKRFIRKKLNTVFPSLFHIVVILDKYCVAGFEPVSYFLSTILLPLHLEGVEEK